MKKIKETLLSFGGKNIFKFITGCLLLTVSLSGRLSLNDTIQNAMGMPQATTPNPLIESFGGFVDEMFVGIMGIIGFCLIIGSFIPKIKKLNDLANRLSKKSYFVKSIITLVLGLIFVAVPFFIVDVVNVAIPVFMFLIGLACCFTAIITLPFTPFIDGEDDGEDDLE